ncbi:hypothetical protein [Chryseobacterium sp. M5A1_1a]
MSWIDMYLGRFQIYRFFRRGTWYKHQFTNDATQITLPEGKTFWARYSEINRYSKVILIEEWF